MRLRPEVFTAITGMIYAALLSNLLLVIGCAPLVVGVLVTDPARSWPLLALVAPLCGPALVGAFAVMTAFGGSGRGGVLRTFGSAWRASFRRRNSVRWIQAAATRAAGCGTRKSSELTQDTLTLLTAALSTS